MANAGDLATRETVSELVLQPQSVLILGNNVGMTIKDLEVRIDRLVLQATAALKNVQEGAFGGMVLRSEEWAALRASGLAFIESTFGQEHSYYREFEKGMEHTTNLTGNMHLAF